MDAALRDHVRYLELRLRDFDARPELHRHQRAAYRHLIDLARLGDLHAGSRDLFEIARSEWLDRFANAAAVQRRLGDPRKQQAAAVAYRAAAAATGPDDFGARIAEAMVRSVTLRQSADAAHGRLMPLLAHLLEWVTEREPTQRMAALSAVRSQWETLRAEDPGCTWARIAAQPSYRRRIPFSDERLLGYLGAWLVAAVGDSAAGPDPEPAAVFDLEDPAAAEYAHILASRGKLPDVSMEPTPLADAVGAYRLAYEAVPRDDPGLRELLAAYERVLAVGAEVSGTHAFLAQLAEEALPVRLARARSVALARESLAHCRPLSQPHAVHHHASLITALEACGTATEVEQLLDWAGECFAVETDWNELLLAYVLRPLRAVAAWALDPSPERQATVVASYAVTCEMFGLDATGVLAVPRLWDFFSRALSPELAAMIGARRGEVGLSVTQDARRLDALFRISWMEQELATGVVGEPPAPTPEQIAALYLDLLARALGHDPAQVTQGPQWRRELLYWDRRVHLDELVGYLFAPPRPRVP